jgi:hypothetical protein
MNTQLFVMNEEVEKAEGSAMNLLWSARVNGKKRCLKKKTVTITAVRTHLQLNI